MTGVRGRWRPGLVGLLRAVRSLPSGGWWSALRDWGPTPLAVLTVRARAHGDRPAFTADGATLTYRELTDAVAALASRLSGTVVINSSLPTTVAVGVLAGLSSGCQVVVVPVRAGSLALDAVLAAHPGAATLTAAGVLTDRPAQRAPSGRSNRPALSYPTTGTTGMPRQTDTGSGLGRLLQGTALLTLLDLPPQPLVACLAPLDHGHGIATLGQTLLLGGRFLAGAPTGPVDLLTGVPAQLEAHLREGPLHPVGVVLSGSDRLAAHTAARLEQVLGARLVNVYGATEVGMICAAGPDDRRRSPESVGRPLPGVRVDVVDAAGQPVPRGESGRLRVRCPRQAAFDCDRGFIDHHGLVHVQGRLDAVVVSGGENVTPAALVAWLAAVPGVSDVAVAPVRDDRFTRLRATLTLQPGASVDAAALLPRIRAELGPALVPLEIVFQ